MANYGRVPAPVKALLEAGTDVDAASSHGLLPHSLVALH